MPSYDVNSHYATVTVSVDNCDGPDDADQIQDLIESALNGAGYNASATVDIQPYQE